MTEEPNEAPRPPVSQRKQSQRIVRNDEPERMEEMAREAHAELPPPGDARREALRAREESLQERIEKIGQSIVLNNIDPQVLARINEIQARTQYLDVSNRQPGYVYGWQTKNRWQDHRARAEAIGWEVVQGDDPEAIELKGTDGIAAGTGTPDTTRQLGDVILMRIKEEYYLAQKGREHARTLQMQVASASTLLSMAAPYMDRGIMVKADPRAAHAMGADLMPRVRPRRFSSKRAQMLGLWNQHHFDQAIREGTLPGLEIEQT